MAHRAGFEPAPSRLIGGYPGPLDERCVGAGSENRTRVLCLEDSGSALSYARTLAESGEHDSHAIARTARLAGGFRSHRIRFPQFSDDSRSRTYLYRFRRSVPFQSSHRSIGVAGVNRTRMSSFAGPRIIHSATATYWQPLAELSRAPPGSEPGALAL